MRLVLSLGAALALITASPVVTHAQQTVSPFTTVAAVVGHHNDCDHSQADICKSLQHPRHVDLKPIPCIPIKYDQWEPLTVVIKFTHADGYEWTEPRTGAQTGLVGQFCYGLFRFVDYVDQKGTHGRAVRIELCNGPYDVVLNEQDIIAMVERARAHVGRYGFYVTLKGSEWQRTHQPNDQPAPATTIVPPLPPPIHIPTS